MVNDVGNVMMVYYLSIVVTYVISIFRYHESNTMVMNLGVILLGIGMYQTLINKT
jgi:hypothetical protein